MKKLFKAHQSVVYALIIIVLLSAWFASGYLQPEPSASTQQTAQPARSLLQKVRVTVPLLKRVSQEIVLNGRMEPARAITLRAEVEGRVIELGRAQGSMLQQDELIAQLDSRDRQARLNEARARLKQRQLEYSGAGKLHQQNLQSEIQLARIATELESARAQVAAIELEIRNTRILAPFAGILDRLPIEVGSYLTPGSEVARVLEQNPIIFVGYVSQQERHRLVLGDRGIVRLMTGLLAEGELRYIAAEADPATRTYKVELHIPNPGGSLVSGASAELRIPVRYVSALQVSPAVLSLNSRDELGIKIVNDDNRVEFLPVRVIRAAADGLWISGVSEGTRIITVGQGFVRTGEQVIAIDERTIGSQSAGE